MKTKKKGNACSSGNNVVARHAYKTNRSLVFKDRKKAVKRGDQKHKKINVERYSIAA